ncbi:FecR domain-containing protein [Sandaracinobacter sp. RS1-74]|uniref:FecR family protein n=1 Tax=Sandaracinobacteroides sayramensis TaxID=2913411 RepID=UPI001EDB5BB2|nr:FecR domain-containing protein [Sandaracinobacteroides sayramensis]MCG2841293.1 FecR domain-containing protein [Sandaracinobacteroides sayramensis]
MSNPSDPYRDDAEPGSDPVLRERAQYWITRLVAKDISATELDTLEAWLVADPRHARAFARERALWQDLDTVADALAAPPPAQPVIRPMPRQGVTRRRLLRAVPVALAASIVAALIIPSLVLDLRADHRTAVGEVRSVALPDGTTAMLDSDSAISVAFDGNRRVVHLLAGRAWFDVRHEGRPFLVEALDGETHDIGTGFEVRRDGGAVEVGVTQGAVQVRAPGSRSGPTLHAGDRVRYTAAGLDKLAAQPAARLASWRKGELLFDKQPVQDAIAEIARYRRAPVWTIGDLGNADPVSGLFLIERPDEALETVVQMRGLRMTTLPGGIVIIRPNPAP